MCDIVRYGLRICLRVSFLTCKTNSLAYMGDIRRETPTRSDELGAKNVQGGKWDDVNIEA